MAVRMIEYDFAIAIEYAAKQGRRYEIEFPRSCVLFLRSSGNTPDFLETNVIFPDGRKQMYRVPTVKMADYTAESIFEKNLLMLLPFYIMRYEKRAHDMRENPRLFQTLLNEYEEIRVKLEKELTGSGRSELYTDLIKLIVKISDYIFQDEEKIQKLREYDWNDFNAERRFREHQTSLLDCMELLLEEKESGESQPESVEALLDTVENEELLQILLSTDKKTLQMVVLKMMGYAPKEISHHMELPEQTVYTRLRRLREKIKKSMKFE